MRLPRRIRRDEQWRSRRLRADHDHSGLAAIRSLLADPGSVRRTIASATRRSALLLDAVRDSAIRSRALRVSLQAESDDATALRLFTRQSFSTIEGCCFSSAATRARHSRESNALRYHRAPSRSIPVLT